MDAATCKATIEALGFDEVAVGVRDVRYVSERTGRLELTGDRIVFAEGTKADGGRFHFSHFADVDAFDGFVRGAEDTAIDEVFRAHDRDDGPNGFKRAVSARLGDRATPETIDRAVAYLRANLR